ncbi:MAG: HupE/UreJ family protein [Hyphomonadaceae bacterium]|nr:HupE/UreJ family protein [Hyphomonadaceae bacterium]
MMRAARLLFVWLLAAIGIAPVAMAHEIRPAFLEIREIEPATYDMLWKTPAQGEMRLALNVILPKECADARDPRAMLVEGAVIERWRTACEGGLVGKQIVIENLQQTLTDAILRFEPIEGSPKTLRLTPSNPTAVIPARQPWTEIAATYFGLGVEHILLGFDHLLFVLALLLLVRDPKRLFGAVTAFTVAHSLTLAGTTFGWVKLASAPVEATIALSIMFVAIEIARVRAGRESLTAQLPWLASFAFGLLHGFGFAGALREIGIPEDAAPLALLFFNLGVEAGQLLFVGAVLATMALWGRFAPASPKWAWRVPVYVIGSAAAFWFVERTAGVLGL